MWSLCLIGFIADSSFASFGAHDLFDGGDHFAPAFVVGGELLLAESGNAVELGALVALALLPFGRDPALTFEAMERWVKRACLDLENFA